MVVKRCPLCGGRPVFINYVLPYDKHPQRIDKKHIKDYFKNRVECEDCHASTTEFFVSLEDAVDCWNKGRIFQLFSIGNPREVEPEE